MKHTDWFNARAAADSVNAAAGKADLKQQTLSRHLRDGVLPAESVIKISRAYDYNPIQGLVDTGYLNAVEMGEGVTLVTLRDASDHDLLAEMLRRIDTGKDLAELWMRPLDDEFVEEIAEGAGKPRLRIVSDEEIREAANGDVAAKTDPTWELETDQ